MGEDYEIEVDGVMLNISKVARMRKRRFGEIRFNKLKMRRQSNSTSQLLEPRYASPRQTETA